MSTHVALLLAALLLTAALLAGCASVPRDADRLFVARSWERAADAYDRWLAEHPAGAARDRALFHLALIHALPDSRLHDPARAELLLRRLRELHPESVLVPSATVVVELLDRVQELRRTAAARRTRIAELELAALACRESVVDAETVVPEADPGVELRRQLAEERRACERALGALRDEAATREEELARLEGALEALKKIDLEDEPGGP